MQATVAIEEGKHGLVREQIVAAHGGRDFLEILLDALNKAGSARGAARLLDCSPTAIRYYIYRFNIRTRKVYVAARI